MGSLGRTWRSEPAQSVDLRRPSVTEIGAVPSGTSRPPGRAVRLVDIEILEAAPAVPEMSARHVVIHSASERVRLPQLGQFVGAALISIAPTWRGREVAFKTKCPSDRVIPIHPAAMDVLRERQARRVSEHPDEPVFLGPRGRHLGRSQINRAFRVARKEAGLPGSLNVHGCRHTFAVWLLTAGESLYRVSRLLGHDSIKITADTYGGLLSEQSAIGMDVFRS